MSHFYRAKVQFYSLLTGLVFGCFLLGISPAFSQTLVSPAASVTNFCTGTTQALTTITVSETSVDGFSVGTGVTFVLTPPANFLFDTSSSTNIVVTSAGDLVVNTPSVTPTATDLTISFDVLTTLSLDFFTISGLKVTAIAPASSGNIIRPAAGAGGTFAVTGGQADNGSGASYGFVASLDPPSITSNPSGQNLCENLSASFSVTATGPGLTYQWQVDTGGGFADITMAGGPLYSGYTSPTLSVGNLVGLNNAQYQAVVSGTCSPAATSTPALLVVNPIPAIPGVNSPTPICVGGINPTLTATGTGPFDWFSDAGLTINVNPNSASYTPGVNATPGTYTYYLIQTVNACRSAARVATIVVNSAVVASAGGPQAICNGQNVTLGGSPTASGGNGVYTFDWQVGGISVSNLSNPVLSPTADTLYDLTVTDANSCSAVASAAITVKPVPILTQQVDITACPAASQSTINFVTNADPVTSYIWNVTNSAALGLASGSGTTGNIPGWTFASNLTGADIIGVATVTATKNSCTSAPMVFNITLKAQPVLSAQSNVVYCPGVPIAINFVSNVTGSNITWSNSNTAIGISANGTGDLNFTAPANNTSSSIVGNISVVATKNGCASAPLLFTITIKPSPQFTIANTTPILCEGSPVNITLSSITTGAVMTLTGLNYGGGSGTPIPIGTTFTNGQQITESISNPTNLAITVVYTFTVAANGCSNPSSQSTSVIVKPNPSANASNVTICSGQNAIVTINGSPENVVGTTYDWTVMASGNVIGAIADNGSLINQNLSLTDFLVGTVQYQITPTANGCVGPVKNITVTINPVALVDAGIDYQVCEPVTIPLSGTIGGAATTGTWVVVTGAGSVSSSTTAGVNVTAAYTVNASDITNTIVLRLQTNDPDAAGPCVAVSDLVNIQINRKPTVSLPADYTVCEPMSLVASPLSLTGTIGGSATTGLWSLITGVGGLSATNVSGSTVTANYTINPSDVGTTVTFRLTTNDADGSGPCTSAMANINILINPRAIVSAGPDLALCRDIPSIALQGSFAGSTSTVNWTGGAGIFSNSANATSNYSFNNPSEINTNVTLTLTALDPDGAGPCASVADQMVLRINQLPVVVFSGLPPGTPPNIAENQTPVTLLGNQVGGLFTISPASSNIGSTSASPVDRATFTPSAVTLGVNTIFYTYTDFNGCTNHDQQDVIINPVTSATFSIQNAFFNTGTSTHELCAEQGLLDLVGFPDFNKPLTGPNQFTGSAGLQIIQSGGPGAYTHTVKTTGLASGTYTITYHFVNEFGAPSDNIYAVKVFASPIAAISNGVNNCISSPVDFIDGSSIPSTPFPTAISSWVWDFKDGTFGNTQNPSHLYTTAGVYNVALKVTTSQGCSDVTSLSLRVGNVPIVDFGWAAICTNDLTMFSDKTNPGISTIISYEWDFDDANILGPGIGAVPPNTHGGSTTGTFKDPLHNYSIPAFYDAKLTVATNDGCISSITKNIFILDASVKAAPSPGNPYKANFEGTVPDGAGWIAEGLAVGASVSPISWIFGTPSGTSIKTTPPGTGGSQSWWTGYNIAINSKSTYFDNESSVVNGPCFDLRQLTRPMIAFDYWSDAERNLDGAVVQYSINGGIDWLLVGPAAGLAGAQRDQGVNWYDPNATIVSNPGGQIIGQYGWTDKSGQWKNARFNLDMVDKNDRDQVRIRIAFSSNNQNAAGNTYDGFAFDNVYVGDKQRNVLVEHFTNSSLTASLDGDAYINGLYQDQITFRGTSDFTDIQYHVSYPNTDALNKDNPSDPASRALYFGVSQPPATIMDGILDGVKFKGKYTDIDRPVGALSVELDRRALKDPVFDLQLTNVATSSNNQISVQLTMTALQDFNSPLIAQVALIENQVGIYKNVLRKQLFGADGETITTAFVKNDVLTKSKNNISINVPLTDPTKTTLIGYVQDKNTREILQTILIAILPPYKQGAVITAIEEPVVPTTLNGIAVYPNPANGTFNFKLPENRSADGFTWKLIDQRGMTLRSGNFYELQNDTKEVDVRDLANGIYFVMISGPGKSVVYQKLVVMNRN